MYQNKLPIVSVKPVDSQYLLSGAYSADVGEEVLVVGCGGEGELGEYLPSIHQPPGQSYLYLCFWHGVGSQGGLAGQPEISGDHSVGHGRSGRSGRGS